MKKLESQIRPAEHNDETLQIDTGETGKIMRVLLVETPEQRTDIEKRAGYAFGLHEIQRNIAKFITEQKQRIEALSKRKAQAISRTFIYARRRTTVQGNKHARLLDDVSDFVLKGIEQLEALVIAMERYLQDTKDTYEGMVQKDAIPERHLLETEEARANSMSGMIASTLEYAENYPDICRDAARTIDAYKRSLVTGYIADEDDEEEEMNPFALLFGRRKGRRVEDGAPLYKNNPHLTALLHDVYRQIPTPTKVGKKGEAVYAPADVSAFVNYLSSLGDQRLLSEIDEGEFFAKMADALEECNRIWSSIRTNIQRSGLDQYKAANPGFANIQYQTLMQRSMRELEGAASDRSKRDISDSIGLLRSNNLSKLPKQFQSEEPKDRKEEKLLETFKQIDKDLREIAEAREGGKYPAEAIEKKANQYMQQKYVIDETSHGQRRKKKINHARKRGNYVYRVSFGGVDALELKPVVPLGNSLVDMIGASWRQLKKCVEEDLFDYAENPHLHTTLSPRNRSKMNAILLGPPGCGKNLGMEAILSDPRIVGVRVSCGDMLTAWAGESSANIGRLYRETRAKIKDNTIAVIAFDEFDDMFTQASVEGVMGAIAGSMKTELQNKMDDPENFDISLWGLSNEPSKIPPAIYRRIGESRVFIIQALDEIERMQLLNRLMRGIPQEPELSRKINQKEFYALTKNASGEVLGKIADRLYTTFRKRFKEKHPRRYTNIQEQVVNMEKANKAITVDDKRGLFMQGSGRDTFIDIADFREAVRAVTSDDVTKGQMRYQEDWYTSAPQHLAQAFIGRDPPPFDLPRGETI